MCGSAQLGRADAAGRRRLGAPAGAAGSHTPPNTRGGSAPKPITPPCSITWTRSGAGSPPCPTRPRSIAGPASNASSLRSKVRDDKAADGAARDPRRGQRAGPPDPRLHPSSGAAAGTPRVLSWRRLCAAKRRRSDPQRPARLRAARMRVRADTAVRQPASRARCSHRRAPSSSACMRVRAYTAVRRPASRARCSHRWAHSNSTANTPRAAGTTKKAGPGRTISASPMANNPPPRSRIPARRASRPRDAGVQSTGAG